MPDGLTTIPTTSDDSAGRDIVDADPPADYDHYVRGTTWNTVKNTLITLAARLGLGDGSQEDTIEAGAINDRSVRAEVTTTDATSTVAASISLEDLHAYLFELDVVGRDQAGVEWCAYRRLAGARKEGGSSSISTVATPLTQESDPGLNANLVLGGGGVVQAQITGLAATTMHWKVVLKAIKVS